MFSSWVGGRGELSAAAEQRGSALPSKSRPWGVAPAGLVSILDVDPDLAGAVTPGDLPALRRELVAPVYRLPRRTVPSPHAESALGYLVLKGLLLREVSVYRRATAELFGEACLVDLRCDDATGLQVGTRWSVFEPALVADLGAIADRIARSPEVTAELFSRSAEQAANVAVQRSICSHVRVDVRLLAMLWQLAEQFGVVVPGEVRVELPLTHATLATLVGARRPTVTTALQTLIHLGYVRRDERMFILVGDASAVTELASRRAVQKVDDVSAARA